MKILSSSPYAAFNAKEWNLATKCPKGINVGASFKFPKKYNRRFKTSGVSINQKQGPDLVQLSFA